MQDTGSFIGACWEQVAILIDHPDFILIFSESPRLEGKLCIHYVVEKIISITLMCLEIISWIWNRKLNGVERTQSSENLTLFLIGKESMLNYRSREDGDVRISLTCTLILKLWFMVGLSLISYFVAWLINLFSWLCCDNARRSAHDISFTFEFEEVTT